MWYFLLLLLGVAIHLIGRRIMRGNEAQRLLDKMRLPLLPNVLNSRESRAWSETLFRSITRGSIR
jgi:hypothetical protein